MPVGAVRVKARRQPSGAEAHAMPVRGVVAPTTSVQHFNRSHLLMRIRPDLSAGLPMWRWQEAAAAVSVIGLLLTALMLPPDRLAIIVTVGLAIPFLAVFLLRLLAVIAIPAVSARAVPRLPDAECPTYAVLVPLYDEAAIVPALVDAMAGLDYPRDRLAIRFIVEADDARTYAAFAALALPPHMQVFVAPHGFPRTKPRACNIALAKTPGQFVVVYDAEDLPEPDQLRRAVSAFGDAPEEVVCLQARLNTFNPKESWLARQFTIEYSALFDLMLPALYRFGLPVPLGGTSNHFRRSALEAALGWDPYNVTEDADLGIRLARFGMRVGVLDSTTWEEGPPRLRVWIGQRTRWLKGWMITYLVHMRQPLRLLRELGWWPFVGFQLLMASMFASALVHPWFYVLLGHGAITGSFLAPPESGVEHALWWLTVINLAAGYVSAVLVGAIAVWRRGRKWLIPHLVLLPLYWLLISYAAYRALTQLFVSPFHWEKTRHRARLHVRRRGAAQSQPN